ncbi:hypothetical protein B7494_g6056 [Chlorociboria aeruginascens]|nr:hypothetical protein B7494_g6056 [Chlorociboria aeruginascens]
MAEPSEDVQVKMAGEAAGELVETYYHALNTPKARSTLPGFYITPTATSPLQPDISLNGNIIPTPKDLQDIFEKQVDRSHYEVQSFDCQVLNTNYNVGAPEQLLGPKADGKKISILVFVSGSVRYWKEGVDGDTRGFTENFVLVPNWDVKAKGDKKWLIQSQNFRLVF